MTPRTTLCLRDSACCPPIAVDVMRNTTSMTASTAWPFLSVKQNEQPVVVAACHEAADALTQTHQVPQVAAYMRWLTHKNTHCYKQVIGTRQRLLLTRRNTPCHTHGMHCITLLGYLWPDTRTRCAAYLRRVDKTRVSVTLHRGGGVCSGIATPQTCRPVGMHCAAASAGALVHTVFAEQCCATSLEVTDVSVCDSDHAVVQQKYERM